MPLYKRTLEIREQLAQDTSGRYDFDICQTFLGLSLLYYKLSKESPKVEYIQEALTYIERAITLLRKYPDIPKAQEYMEIAEEFKTYFEGVSLENLQMFKEATAYQKQGDDLVTNNGSKEEAKGYYHKAIDLYETLIAKERNLQYLADLSFLYNSLNTLEDSPITNLTIQEKIVTLQEEVYQNYHQNYQENTEVKAALAQSYGEMAWYLALNMQFERTEEYAHKGLELDSSQEWINTNLALAYLFSGQYAQAEAIYVQFKDKPYDDRTFKEAFLEDLQTLEDQGITHPDVAKIRRLLDGEPGQ